MFVILPTRDLVRELHFETEQFCQKYQLSVVGLPECFQIVQALLDDLMSHRFLWCPNSRNADHVMDQLVEWYSIQMTNSVNDERMPISDLFYQDVLDRYAMRLDAMLINIIPHRTWDVWYLNQMGSDLVLDKGTDFRLMEFNRNVLSGEWKVDDVVYRNVLNGHS